MIDIVNYVKEHWVDIANVIAYAIALASIVVKLTPTPKDNEFLDKIKKFVGKYIALNP